MKHISLTLIILSLSITHSVAQGLFNEAAYTPAQTVFHLNAPKAAKIRIYDSADSRKPAKTVTMKKVATDRWEATVKGNLLGKFYTFDIGLGETPGTFAKAVGVNGTRAAIIDMDTTNPNGWDDDRRPPLTSFTDQVIYEIHQRDYSIDASAGFCHKGKYLAWTEPKALRHLKDLGVTSVHFQPLFDFASIDESQPEKAQFNWGYDPLNFNVPEGYYATDATDPAVRIREFKQMVMAFHKAGIRVVFDAVYNHCNDISRSAFQRTYPDYYYRLAKDGNGTTGDIGSKGGKYSDGSGCGNETASEKPLMREYMIESVKYWINEYHIDGFRFDLMGIHDIETMNLIRKAVDDIDPSIFIYGEGWSCGPCAIPNEQLAMKIHTPQLNRIAAFDDDLRDALRGPFTDDHKGGFVAGVKGNEQRVMFGIAGCTDHPQVDLSKANGDKAAWAPHPTQAIQYVSCHDDMCLVDRLRATVPGIGQEELIRLDLLAQTAVFTAQGVPFMLGGEEMLRDKKNTHNSYNAPDSINHLDWTNLELYPQVFNYYKNLIAMRHHHKAFRMERAEDVKKYLLFLKAPRNVVAWQLDGKAVGDTWQQIVVILNSNRKAVEVNVPEGCYDVVCRNLLIDERGFDKLNGSKVCVPAQSALILKK